MTRLAVGLIFVVFLTSCTSAIVVHDRSEVVVTRKFGPSDLTSLAAKLMKELDNCHDDWTKSKPTLAIADIYNDTDKPGLNKQPIFDEFGSAIYKMKKFNLINHRKTKELLDESKLHLSPQFDNRAAIEVGQVLRAHYILWGDVSSSIDVGADYEEVKQYRLSINITDVETHEIVFHATATASVKSVR